MPGIIGSLPDNIANGQVMDAGPLMANFNWLMNQVNANAASLSGANVFAQAIQAPAATTGVQLATAAQVQNGVNNAADSGVVDAYICAPAVPVTSYSNGQQFTMTTANTNTLTNPTLTISALAAKTIVSSSGGALIAGQIVANKPNIYIYDVVLDSFRLLGTNADNATTAANLSGTPALPNGTTATTQTVGDSTTKLATDAFVMARPVMGTPQATTSGTAVSFTGLPSWIKKITMMFNGVSTNSTSFMLVQLGTSGGFVTTGYSGTASALSNTNITGSSITTGFGINTSYPGAASVQTGSLTFHLMDATNNIWTCSGCTATAIDMSITAGTVALSALLTQIRLTTVNGSDTFDAGSINIMYE